MRTILLATVAAATLVSGAAFAADLPRRTIAPVAPPPIVAVPVFTWSGFYIGANAGYGFNANDDDEDLFGDSVFGDLDGDGDADARDTALAQQFGLRSVGPFGSGEDDEEGGFVGGGQVGFNIQAGSIVYGIEADIQYVDLNQNADRFGFVRNDDFFEDDGDDAFFGTVRGRVGFAFGQALLYATGGLAYGDVGNVAFMNQFGVRTTTDDDINLGWTVGGGLEYAITNNITVKIEGLYVNLEADEQDNFRPLVVNNQLTFVNDGRRAPETEFAVVRAGVNFKFSSFGF